MSPKETYGEYSQETEFVRYVLDILNRIFEGQELIRLYYQWSPAIVKVMEKDERFKSELKEMIDGVLDLIV